MIGVIEEDGDVVVVVVVVVVVGAKQSGCNATFMLAVTC